MAEVIGLCNHHSDRRGEMNQVSAKRAGWNRFNASLVDGEVR